MNLRELEALLRELSVNPESLNSRRIQLKVTVALRYVQRKQATAHKRHVFFKLRADEQREMLR